MKFKEKDLRPKHLFQMGDRAETRINKVTATVIVIDAVQALNDQKLQQCKVILEGRPEQTFTIIRDLVNKRTTNPSATINGYLIPNTRMTYLGRVPDEWLRSITSKEISNLRFAYLMDDE